MVGKFSDFRPKRRLSYGTLIESHRWRSGGSIRLSSIDPSPGFQGHCTSRISQKHWK